jgi:glycosyltransferase involved in cell wall biosynthesis
MNIVAIATARNEIDIVEAFVRHTLTFANRLVILDNGSSDGTLEVLHALAEEGLPVTVIEDPSLGHYQSRRMTGLMREHAVDRYRADWVLPLDADEFVAVVGDNPLVDEASPTDRPIALPWRSYVPNPSDDPALLNPAARIRNYVEDGRRIIKVMVPGKLAALPDAVLIHGSHEFEVGGKCCEPIDRDQAYLAHFPIRSPGQYLAKIVLRVLQYKTMPKRGSFLDAFYRRAFELLKRDPRAFLAGYADDGHRYTLFPHAALTPAVITAPFPYRGGPLYYTPSSNDEARGWRAILTYAEQLALEHGILATCLNEDGSAFQRCADVIADLRTKLDQVEDQAVKKEQVIQDQHRQLLGRKARRPGAYLRFRQLLSAVISR